MRILALILLLAGAFAAAAQAPAGAEFTPPRLSFVDGPVSFWRPGAQDWAQARINTPLAAGDALYAGERGNLEVQAGPRQFVRAAERTHLGIVAVEPDFLQVKLTGGQAALDLRSLPAGHTVELDTPNAVFTVEHTGYYRVTVSDDTVYFIARRGGQATVTLANGVSHTLSPSEELVIRGAAVETYAAPEPDAWDRWNYARTDYESEAISARYVPPGVYGVGVLDHWGRWRVVPEYGAVWFPDRIARGWAPYSAGSWIWDPYYGWTWLDDAPWGWAPYHYGRWVLVSGFWGWAPGPLIVRPAYAPALVAFYSAPGPAIGWVALGWGEPLHPWWGPPGFIGTAWWGGWGGPRIARAVVHTERPIVIVAEKQFGRGPVRPARLPPEKAREAKPIREAHPVRPGIGSFAPQRRETVRPPPAVASRPTVTTKPSTSKTPAAAAKVPAAPPKVVPPPPKRAESGTPAPRPSFAEKGVERARPPLPPQPPRTPAQVRPAPQVRPQAPSAPPAAKRGDDVREARPGALPGRPASVVPRQSPPASPKAAKGATAPRSP
ncbi:MAG: fecR family protein [Burkholderiales bacterium]|nr:fecR family protein [Burkholderiales bacterium]